MENQEENKLQINQEFDRQAKQRYLVEEIIEKGYDSHQFTEFITSKKENGLIIDNWSFKELQQIVQQFQDIQQSQPYQTQEEEEDKNELILEDPQSIVYHHTKNPDEDDSEWDTECTNSKTFLPFVKEGQEYEFIQVQQCQPTYLNMNFKKIKVRVCNPKITQTSGFFLFKYNNLHFKVKIRNFGWEVTRSESDFYQLRRLLLLAFPHLIIPPLPQQKESKYTEKSIMKRRKYLQRFLRAVLKCELLCTYPFLVEFLMIAHEDPKSFCETMKYEELYMLKMIDPIRPKIEELCSLEDCIQTTLQPQTIGFKVQDFLTHYEENIQGILDTTKLIQQKSYNLSNSYKRLQEILMKISQIHGQNDSMIELELWANMSKVFGSESYFLEEQSDLIQYRFSHLRFNIDYINSIKEFQLKYNYLKNQYFQQEKLFLKKREKVLSQLGIENQDKISSKQLNQLLPVEQVELHRRRQLMIVFMNQMLNEVQRFQEEVESQGIKKEMCHQLAKDLSEELNPRHIVWAELVRSLDKIVV